MASQDSTIVLVRGANSLRAEADATASDGGCGFLPILPYTNGYQTEMVTILMRSSAATHQATTASSAAVLTNDQRIATALRDRIQQSPYLPIRQLTCEFREGVAILRGTVPTYFTRQVAITLALSVDSVEVLDDRIQVSRP
jgi:osmotically-inducible protein OsmY